MDRKNSAGVVRVPGWERLPWLRAAFSMRRGGVSTAFGDASLNLGWKDLDTDDNVRENRLRLLSTVMADAPTSSAVRMVTLRQVHRDGIHILRQRDAVFETASGRAVLEGDGLLTAVPGLMLAVQNADCVPVLVADTRLRIVGAFHAGWRGTLAGIVGRGVHQMVEAFQSHPRDLVAALGPSIGACCYAVGEDVQAAFQGRFPSATKLLHSHAQGAVHLDLWEANRQQLIDTGVPPDATTVLGECTACSREDDGSRRYFSHRAELGRTGGMMGIIGLLEPSSAAPGS